MKQIFQFFIRFGICAFALCATLNAQAANALHVHGKNGNDNNTGYSWDAALKTIQAAIDKAETDSTIWVDYAEDHEYQPISITKNVSIKASGYIDKPIINAQSSSRCVYLSQGSLSGFYLTMGRSENGGCIYFDGGGTVSSCVLEYNNTNETEGNGGFAYLDHGGLLWGCEMRSGAAAGHGGAIFVDESGVVQNCEIENITAGSNGGGIYLNGGGTVNGCNISGTSASQGGAVYISGAGTLNGCSLYNNRSSQTGGGVYCNDGGVLNQCFILNNESLNYSGGVRFWKGGTLNNCLVKGNVAKGQCGGVEFWQGGTLCNCTIVSNTASGNVDNPDLAEGGGVHLCGGIMNNCIVWGNFAPNASVSGPNICYESGTIEYCCSTEGLSNGVNGCTTNNPMFTDAASGDYSLQEISPCVDTGNSSEAPVGNDLNGNPRIFGSSIDMGAYEYTQEYCIEPEQGPASGGNELTLTFGLETPHYSGVVFGDGPTVDIISQTSNTLSVIAPPHAAGSVELTLEADSVTNLVCLLKNNNSFIGGLSSLYFYSTGYNPGRTTNVVVDGVSVEVLGVTNHIVTIAVTNNITTEGEYIAVYQPGIAKSIDEFYTYLPEGTITSVFPDSAPVGGGVEIQICGTQLCSGAPSNIPSVTLCGTDAIVQVFFPTQLIVTAQSGIVGAGDVVVTSDITISTATNAFSYVKADQTIVFPIIGNQLTTNTVVLSATGGGSTNPVTFAVASGPAVLSGTTLSFTGAGSVSVTADQAGDDNYNPSPTVTNTFSVSLISNLVTYADADNGSDSNDGLSWAAAKQTIQAAINLVGDGGAVWVTNGVYDAGGAPAPGYALTNRVCISTDITVRSVNGPEVTLIQGAPDPAAADGFGSSAVRGVWMNAGTLDGFTVTNGCTGVWSASAWENANGGGAFLDGGGMLTNCTLTGNSADCGGGAWLWEGGTLNHCELSGNSADEAGGGAAMSGGTVNNCTAFGNSVTATNGLGGGIFVLNGTLNNCTLSGNSASEGGGITAGNSTLNNSIVWGNSASLYGMDISICSASNNTVRYTCAADGVINGINGCITNNPLFVSTNDFRLQPGSPCINAGDNSCVTTHHDLDGNERILFGTVDLGAYESLIPPVSVPVALSAINITDSQFIARWEATDDATNYVVDVSSVSNFTAMTGFYDNWSVGDGTACLITGLTDGVTYWYRVRGENQYGQSGNSNIIEVPVSTNTPYVKQEIPNGVVSANSSDVLELSDLFHGTGMSYEIITNTNPDLVTASIDEANGTLTFVYGDGPGSATITVRCTDPNGFYVDNTITVYVTDDQPVCSAGAVTLNMANGLFEQIVCVTNTSAYDAQAVTLTVADLSVGATLYNATGTDPDGNAEILWVGTLAGGASMDFTLQYSVTDMRVTPSATVTVSLSLSVPDVELDEDNEITLVGTAECGDTFVIAFEATIGATYYIQYTDDLSSNDWKTAYPSITALSEQVQWVDSGPPVTEEPGDTRCYRVIRK
jgi:hypothetical protein